METKNSQEHPTTLKEFDSNADFAPEVKKRRRLEKGHLRVTSMLKPHVCHTGDCLNEEASHRQQAFDGEESGDESSPQEWQANPED